MQLGIDVQTRDIKVVMRRLGRLKSTESIASGGAYREDQSYSQVHVDTSMSEDELDHWLWKTKGVDYVGVFDRSGAQ
jgi:hypothetical protein